MMTSPLRTLRFATAAAFVLATFSAPATAQQRTPLPSSAVHGYLYIPGIKGDVTATGYRDWHAVDSYRLDAVRSKAARTRTAGVKFSPLAVSADLGMALPQLVVRCASGRRLTYVILRMLRQGERLPFVEFRLYDVAVYSAGNGANTSGGGQVIEFDYARMTMTQTDPTTGKRSSRYIDRRRYPFSRGKSVPVSGSSANQFDAHVRVNGIAGNSRRAGYRGWHELKSYGLSVRQAAGGRAVFEPLRLESGLSALPEFTMALASGQAIRNVEVHVWSKRVTTGPVLVIKLSNVQVCVASSTVANNKPGQTLELSYGRIEFQYYRGGRRAGQTPAVGGWDVASNRAI